MKSEKAMFLRRFLPAAMIAGAALVLLGMQYAGAQANNSNTWATPGNQMVGGSVHLCLNSTNQAIPCQGSSAAGFPAGATPVVGVFSGADTTSQAATLASGGAGKTTYICGFSITGLGATGSTPVSPTVATIAPGSTLTYSYLFVAGATLQNVPVTFTYSPCLPASAAAAAITVTVPGAAGNTATQINAWGFQF